MNLLKRLRSRTRSESNWTFFSLIVLCLYSGIIGSLYSPAWDANFQGDDYRYVRDLFFNFKSLLNGQGWDTWLSASSGWPAWTYFRPLFQFSYMQDYIAWGLNPVGYHLSNLILHVLTSFMVFLVGWQLVKNRFMAIMAGLLFGLMPIHVEPVFWFGARADGLSALYYLVSVEFFILFRRRRNRVFLLTSLCAFIMALLTKEVSVTLPMMLIIYDLLYDLDSSWVARREYLPHILFWAILTSFVGFRVIMWSQTGSYGGATVQDLHWDYITQALTLDFADPFFLDMTAEIRSLLLGIFIVVLLLFRRQREVLFGAAWMCVTIPPSLLSADRFVFDRYVYLPSIGFLLVLVGALSCPAFRLRSWPRVISSVILSVILVVYVIGLDARNQEWARAAQITRIVQDQVHALHPTLPYNARLVFTNVPVLVEPRGKQVFGGKLPLAMQLIYGNPQLQVLNFEKFPIWTDNLDRTFLFEYKRRKITERQDLIQALETRNLCVDFSFPGLEWDFSGGVQGWEPWNQLSNFEVREGALLGESSGDNPYMASPLIDIPTMAIGTIEISMRVRADQPSFNGWVYWLASGQRDFSPGLRQQFQVLGDGDFHTYRVDISKTGQLLIGDHILRLRLDPIDGPGEIALRSIRLNINCTNIQGESCQCLP